MPETGQAPFFIVGCPRSGTTLLQVLLDRHPDLAIPPESHVFDHFAELFDYYGELSKPENLRRFVKDLLEDERIKTWKLQMTVDGFCAGLKDFSVAGVLKHLFNLYTQREGKTVWGDKTPEHMLYLREIKTYFPGARIIHLVRDGRDVAESLGRVYFGPSTVEKCALLWKEYLESFQAFKKGAIPGDFLELRYEDLVRRPQEELAKVCRFLKVREIEPVLPESRLKAQYTADTVTHGSLNAPVSDAKVGLYKKQLSLRTIEIFEQIAGEQLRQYGYPLETSGGKPVTAQEKMFFIFQEQLYRFTRKFNQWNYNRDRIQFHVRRWRRKFLKL